MEQHINTPLLIVSFHRSGSSLTANLLQASGLHLGDQLLGARPSNPHGHFEDRIITSLHDQHLAATNHAWFSERGPVSMLDPCLLSSIKDYSLKKCAAHKAFGVKDPRLCLTIRHWHAALGKVNVLFIHRNARDCVSSLWNRALRAHRDGEAMELNAALVDNPGFIARMYAHNLASFLSWYHALFDKSDRVLFVGYDDLVSGRRDVVEEVRGKWGYALRPACIDDFFDDSAVTTGGDWSVGLADKYIATHLDQIDAQLSELCST